MLKVIEQIKHSIIEHTIEDTESKKKYKVIQYFDADNKHTLSEHLLVSTNNIIVNQDLWLDDKLCTQLNNLIKETK